MRSPAGTSPPRVSKTRSTGPLSTTAAPACRASWTAMCPTPPEAPVTSTRSLRASRPCTNSACQAVSPPIGRAAASTWLSRKGFGASTSAGTTAYSAATPSRSKGVSAYTSSPLPTTTPESSYDGIAGSRSSGHSSSSRVIAAAWTRTSASPGAGCGVATSSTTRLPAPPGACTRTARMVSGASKATIGSLRNGCQRRIASLEGEQVVDNEPGHGLSRLPGPAAEVRGEDDVRQAEQLVRYVRLLPEDVESRTDPAGDELRNECLLVDDFAAGGGDEAGPVAEAGKPPRADQPLRLWGQGRVPRHDLSRGPELVQ